MKKIKILFTEDTSLKDIEVVIKASGRDEDVASLIDRITGNTKDMLTVTDADGKMLRIDFKDIVIVSVSGKQVEVVTEAGRYQIRQTLQSLEERLEAKNFVRISRYEIVNLEKVVRYDFSLVGTVRLELENGLETWASRRNIPMIRKKLTERREQL